MSCRGEADRSSRLRLVGPAGRPATATAAFQRLCKKAGPTGVRLHDLRHMHATELLAAGVLVRTVSGRVGHANTATTLNLYAHFLDARDRDAVNTIGELLRGG